MTGGMLFAEFLVLRIFEGFVWCRRLFAWSYVWKWNGRRSNLSGDLFQQTCCFLLGYLVADLVSRDTAVPTLAYNLDL